MKKTIICPNDQSIESMLGTLDYSFTYDINDKNHVDIELSGYWSGFFTQNFDFTFGNGTRPAFALPTPVFKQDVELSARILLNKHQ